MQSLEALYLRPAWITHPANFYVILGLITLKARSQETAGPWSPEAGKLLDRQLGIQADLGLDLALPLPSCLTLQSRGVDINLPYVAMVRLR